jgi:hypothetical protein
MNLSDPWQEIQISNFGTCRVLLDTKMDLFQFTGKVLEIIVINLLQTF